MRTLDRVPKYQDFILDQTLAFHGTSVLRLHFAVLLIFTVSFVSLAPSWPKVPGDCLLPCVLTAAGLAEALIASGGGAGCCNKINLIFGGSNIRQKHRVALSKSYLKMYELTLFKHSKHFAFVT